MKEPNSMKKPPTGTPSSRATYPVLGTPEDLERAKAQVAAREDKRIKPKVPTIFRNNG
jgi:hypothetical protein